MTEEPAPALRPWRDLRLNPAVPIVVATRNQDKFREIRTLWGEGALELVPAPAQFPSIEEIYDTYEQNAMLKAASAAVLARGPALADDSGIEIEALDWGPGPRSARTPHPGSGARERNAFILEELAKRQGAGRRARLVCVCALAVPGFEPMVARGIVEGEIADRERGSAGFGYDSIFLYPAYAMTFGEVGEEKKRAVSHRALAVRALRAAIASVQGA